jgi:hypothetical protein
MSTAAVRTRPARACCVRSSWIRYARGNGVAGTACDSTSTMYVTAAFR